MEEQRIVRLCAIHEPLHCSNLSTRVLSHLSQWLTYKTYDVLLCRHLARIRRVICQADYVVVTISPYLCGKGK